MLFGARPLYPPCRRPAFFSLSLTESPDSEALPQKEGKTGREHGGEGREKEGGDAGSGAGRGGGEEGCQSDLAREDGSLWEPVAFKVPFSLFVQGWFVNTAVLGARE